MRVWNDIQSTANSVEASDITSEAWRAWQAFVVEATVAHTRHLKIELWKPVVLNGLARRELNNQIGFVTNMCRFSSARVEAQLASSTKAVQLKNLKVAQVAVVRDPASSLNGKRCAIVHTSSATMFLCKAWKQSILSTRKLGGNS
eukprot:11789112-Karenia_brevis.AAC.1